MLACLYRRDDRDIDTSLMLLTVLAVETVETCAIGLLWPYALLGLSAPGS